MATNFLGGKCFPLTLLFVISLASFASAQLPPPAPVPDEDLPIAEAELPATVVVSPGPTSPPQKTSSKPLPSPTLAKGFQVAEKPKTTNKPGQFCVQLQDGTRLTGTLAELNSLPLELDFANIKIPNQYVQSLMVMNSIKVEDNKNEKAAIKERCVVKVMLQNGDMLTGKLNVKSFIILTSYGKLNVPVDSIHLMAAGNDIPVFAQKLNSNANRYAPVANASVVVPTGGTVILGAEVFRSLPAPPAIPKIGIAKPQPR